MNTRILNKPKRLAFFGGCKRWQIVCRKKCQSILFLQSNRAFVCWLFYITANYRTFLKNAAKQTDFCKITLLRGVGMITEYGGIFYIIENYSYLIYESQEFSKITNHHCITLLNLTLGFHYGIILSNL